MTEQTFEVALGQSAYAVVNLLEGAEEAERRKLFPVALKWDKALNSEISAQINGLARDTLWHTVPLAMLGTANLTELKKARLSVIPDVDLAVQLLESRRPDWLQPFGAWILEQNPWSGWTFVRRMMKRNWLARPEGDSYVIGMIAAASRNGAYKLLSSDPDLLAEVELLFEVEGSGEHSLAAYDKYSPAENQWATALIRLSQEDKLSRDKLLSDSLTALTFGFAAFRAGWFSRFYEAMAPTPEETMARVDTLYLLLASPIASTASFALRTLSAVAKKHKLSSERLWKPLGPVWTLAQKGSVLQGLKLLAATPMGEGWLEHLTQAAAHPSPDVQHQALKLLEKVAPQPSGPWRQRWLDMGANLEPSVRGKWAHWLGAEAAPAQSEHVLLEELSEASSHPLKPCLDVQEVFDLASRLLEEMAPPHDIERLLDGLTRFQGQGHLQGPALAKRVKTRMTSPDMRRSLAALLSCWLGTPAELGAGQRPGLEYFLGQRLEELHQALATGQAPAGLHSLPDLQSGYLEASTLGQRLAAQPEPMPWDFTQALLRLRPGHLPLQLAKLPGEADRALEYALTGQARGSRRVKTWWEAADLLRQAAPAKPWSFSVSVTSHVHAAKTYYHRKFRINELAQREGAGLIWKDHVSCADTQRWLALICPALRESFQLLGIEELMGNLDWWEADWSDRVYLETLLDPAESWGRTGAFLGAVGLACKESGQRGLAVDAVAHGLGTARLSPRMLGEVMGEASSTGMVTCQRWARSFDELRRFVSLDCLFETLQTFFAFSAPDFDAKPLLGPLLEVAVGLRRPIEDATARATLQTLKGTGKAGKQAAQILEIG